MVITYHLKGLRYSIQILNSLVTLLVGQSNGSGAVGDGLEEVKLPDGGLTSPSKTDRNAPGDLDKIKLENRLLTRKLTRSESCRERLEEIKDFNSTMHRKIIQEVEAARQEIQRKEMLLRKSEEKYRRIVTTAGEGFILMDEDMIITDANEALCRMMGYAKGELIGKTPFDLGADEFRHFFRTNQEMTPFKEYRKFEGFLKAKAE
jgi:PAS domain-containing protein